ncbi:hypothetical protein ROZALSC1DRAFT_21310 [Rozella allomycis CSF55]|uniref:Uncharacterized protein n=1 Tax=Rozella allomycis (strain CSF55) TaxID=988480 RepID=A0A4P9YLY9_ROZAC|nr:hypothetical protein ROZALSC1DRAFT_21310 [Rozella allomycis CSF55]
MVSLQSAGQRLAGAPAVTSLHISRACIFEWEQCERLCLNENNGLLPEYILSVFAIPIYLGIAFVKLPQLPSNSVLVVASGIRSLLKEIKQKIISGFAVQIIRSCKRFYWKPCLMSADGCQTQTIHTDNHLDRIEEYADHFPFAAIIA